MASDTFQSPHMELHQSKIQKPDPLRIIKRSQTISGSSLGGEMLYRGRGTSGESEESKGSPPIGADRPLTVRKRRKERATVLDGMFDGTLSSGSESTSDPDGEIDAEITPKAFRTTPRYSSPGAFLKSELNYPATFAGRYTVRNSGDSSSSDYADFDLSLQMTKCRPKTPDRAFSRSKSFLRSIVGRSGPEKLKPPKSTEMSVKHTLIRRLSRTKSRTSGSWDSSESTSSSVHSSQDIINSSDNSRASSSGQAPSSSCPSSTTPLLGTPAHFILSPQIIFTSEVSSVDLGRCSFWVAVEVRGILRGGDGLSQENDEYSGFPLERVQNLGSYGYLHSMKIEILPTHNSFIMEQYGDICYPMTIGAGQTRLLIAKISLGKTDSIPGSMGVSSEELMAHLEHHLGDAQHPYLNVKLSYKHSGFLNTESHMTSEDGISSHITRLQTDATATIKRHNSQSAWSPRTSQTLNMSSSPLITIIKNHMPTDQAEETIMRLIHDYKPLPFARRPLCGIGGSSEETVKPTIGDFVSRSDSVIYIPLHEDMSPGLRDMPMGIRRAKSQRMESGPFARLPSRTDYSDDSEEIDPARKIWNEMRQSSKGLSSHKWGGLYRGDSYSDEDLTPTRKSSSAATSGTLNSTMSGESSRRSHRRSDSVEYERSMIMEMALKNKRSLGAETLRSMAPSVAKTLTKSKSVTVGGLGLTTSNRSWGWGPPWW